MIFSHQIMKIPEVCIVGAGMAGLHYVEFFIREGLPVTIYEARNRIGGRLSSLRSTDMELTDSVSSKFFAWTNAGRVNAIAGWFKESSSLWQSVIEFNDTHNNPFVKLAAETTTVILLSEDVHSIFLKDGEAPPMSWCMESVKCSRGFTCRIYWIQPY